MTQHTRKPKRKKRHKRSPNEPYRMFERRKVQGKNRHHLFPESRFPPYFTKPMRAQWGNVINKPIVHHNAWHDLFEELTPEEAIVYLVEHVYPKGTFTRVVFRVNWQGISKRRYRYRRYSQSNILDYRWRNQRGLRHQQIAAYRRLFRKMDPVLVLQHIVQEWSPPGYFVSYYFAAKVRGGESICKSVY